MVNIYQIWFFWFFGEPRLYQSQVPLFFENHGYIYIYIYISQSLFFWFFKPWLYIRTTSSDYLRGLGTHHPNRSYWYLRTMDTKIKQLASEASNTLLICCCLCDKIWNLSTKEGSLFVLFFLRSPKAQCLLQPFSWVLSFSQACYEPVCCTNCVVRSGNLHDLVLWFPQDFHAACW